MKPVKLGIVIDRNGDIRTNMRPNVPDDAFTDPMTSLADLSTDPANGCSGSDVLDPLLMQDDSGTQQYRIGTVSRAFTSGSKVTPNALSLRMILGGEAFGTLNGALIGMNTTIKISPDTNENIVVGGALLQMASLLNAPAGSRPSGVAFTDSAGRAAQWGNSFASFNRTFSVKNPNDAEAKALAKLTGGEISFELAPCYEIQSR